MRVNGRYVMSRCPECSTWSACPVFQDELIMGECPCGATWECDENGEVVGVDH